MFDFGRLRKSFSVVQGDVVRRVKTERASKSSGSKALVKTRCQARSLALLACFLG